MTKKLFDHDPLTGVTEWFEYDDANDSFTICESQDVEAIVEANKVNQNAFDAHDPWGEAIGGRTHVARLPLNVYMELKKRFGNDQAAWKRWLNDSNNRAFRARLGTV